MVRFVNESVEWDTQEKDVREKGFNPPHHDNIIHFRIHHNVRSFGFRQRIFELGFGLVVNIN
jgi:hypothetical protein